MVRGWRPMSTAPRDGTMVLVCETPNGEVWNVLAASFCQVGHACDAAWWGVHYRPSWQGFAPVACTPVCWKPFPQAEDSGRLRRRKSQILRHKYPSPPPIRSGPNYTFEDGDAKAAPNPR
jgi:hypothetical protein